MFLRLVNNPWLVGILGGILVLVGTYEFGKYVGFKEGKAISEKVITDYENKILKLKNELEKKQIVVDTKVETVYVDRIKTIKEKEYVYVNQAASILPASFELSNGWVYLHDQAARGRDADASFVSDGSPSGIKDNQGLEVVIRNYASCSTDRERLKALQEWVTSTHNITINN